LKPFACYGYSELTGLCKGDFEVFVPDLCLARFKKND